ncbi:O-antigen ligase family protein [Leucobacter sp. UCMA 4100]|uniref:O-antigen ligase family protein n=1 Tax=Leucobacter sp. UCMA 4100 TaxID=2810534 RepID=UPI0022EB37B3|nr:O-antigen ligase family protein [Leucobacter sp. UCMA 4100]MDA3146630.1 O-antigen ligase family protein [Leucobacter sp. UCMA 4100]
MAEITREAKHHRLGVNAYATATFFIALGGNAFRNLLGLQGYVALVVVVFGIGIALFIKQRPERFRWYRLPAPLTLFLVFAALSILWSQYRLESLLGVTAQLITTAVAVMLALLLTWQETLSTLASAFRYLLGLSIVFELFVSIFIREPLLPWWIEAPEGKTPNLLYWSRDLLFEGGPIQGLLGSSTLLGFAALLGLIIFVIQLRAGTVRPFAGWFWVIVALATLVLTRPATALIAGGVVVVSLFFALWARRAKADHRMPMYFIGAALLAACGTLAIVFRDSFFGIFGKSGSLTGRTETWQKVIDLGSEHPAAGWGWVSYWAPWVEPFKSLDVQGGIPVMHAHNAWLDVWFQLGFIGLALFGLLVFVTTWRVWFRAVDQPRRGPGAPLPYATSALWPFLIMMAMLVQSLTESRMIVESGWLLLVLFTVKTRFDYEVPSSQDDQKRIPWRDTPIPRG